MNDSRNVPLMGDLTTVVCMDEVSSCISGSRSFIIFLDFIHLRRKLNSLQDMKLHKITEFYTEWFRVYPSITSKFRAIAIFKNCVKQNNGSNKTYRYVHDLLLFQSSFVKVQWFMSCLHKTKYEF
jgi:hypothetical protein